MAALKDATHADLIKQTQKQWIKKRNTCLDADCLKIFYAAQQALLKLPIVTVPAGNPRAERVGHSATLLPNGKVLIAGGHHGNNFLNSAELYDFAVGRFAAAGSREQAGANVATLLSNGKVLLVGGEATEFFGGHGDVYECNGATDLYDPATGRFTQTSNGHALDFRCPSSATLLPNGKVLIVDEQGNFFAPDDAIYLTLYDHTTGTFADVGKLAGPGGVVGERGHKTATLLQDGKLLLAGGETAELYDPATNRVTAAGSLSQPRSGHSATLLPSGKVLLAGGVDSAYRRLASAELYDPATGRFSATGNLGTARAGHTATLLKSGKVLISGGYDDQNHSVAPLELYDPATGTFSVAGRLAVPGVGKTATLLPSGKVLFTGVGTSELYDPAANGN